MTDIDIIKTAWETVAPQALEVGYVTAVGCLIIAVIAIAISIPGIIYGFRFFKQADYLSEEFKAIVAIIVMVVLSFVLLFSLAAISTNLYNLWYMNVAPEAWVLRHLM